MEPIDILIADFKRLDSKYGKDWTEWQDVREAIQAVRVQIDELKKAKMPTVLSASRTAGPIGTGSLAEAFDRFRSKIPITKADGEAVILWYGPYVPGALEPAIVVAARQVTGNWKTKDEK